METHNGNINTDEIVEEVQVNPKESSKVCKDILKNKMQISNWDKFMNLSKQNIII